MHFNFESYVLSIVCEQGSIHREGREGPVLCPLKRLIEKGNVSLRIIGCTEVR